MFKRKASAEEQTAAQQEEQVELAIVNTQGGYNSTSEEHQANRARMVLQATDFAVYQRLKKGSIPSRRNEFTYIVAVYEKSVAEKILQRELTTDSEKEARVTKIGSANGNRIHEVEGTLAPVQGTAWSQEEEEEQAYWKPQDYTVIILENKIDAIKKLEVCKGWDWDPLSSSELDVEVEIYDPRNISTLQKQGAMDVLGMVTTQSVASYMLPAAKNIIMPQGFPELAPTPEAENQPGDWTLIYRDCSVITKCTVAMHAGVEKRQDVPFGARVVLRLQYNGDQEPLASDWPLMPLWVQCPEQIALMPNATGPGTWLTAKAVDGPSEGTFQYPKNGPHYIEVETPDDMFWVNARWKMPGITRGRPALLDWRIEDQQEGEYYALAGLEMATKHNGGREVKHLDRRKGRASRSGSHKSKKKKGGAKSSDAEKPLGWTGKEPAGSVPQTYHKLTRKVQETWKGAIDGRTTMLSQEKNDPCWVVATKALEAGATTDALLIQLSTEGELVARGKEETGLMPTDIIDHRCNPTCGKEPCASAERQIKFKKYAQMRREMIDPGATQRASSQDSQRTQSQQPQTPFGRGAAMAGAKRGGEDEDAKTPEATTGAQAPRKKPSPFRRTSEDEGAVEGQGPSRATVVRPQVAYANPSQFAFAQMGQPLMAGATMLPPQMMQSGFVRYPHMLNAQQAMGGPQMAGASQMTGGLSPILEGNQGGMEWEADTTSAFGDGPNVAEEAAPASMTTDQIADWKANVPAMNRITPAFRRVNSASAKTPWADLSANDESQTTKEMLAMKGAFDQGLGGLQWNKPMWIQDVGRDLQEHGVINDMRRMQQLIEACVEMGTVRSHNNTKSQISFTKELPSRLQLPDSVAPPAHHFLTGGGKGKGSKGKSKGKGFTSKGKGGM